MRTRAISNREWAKLSASERVQQCRDYAREAERLAELAHPDLKERYRMIAMQWHDLADAMAKMT
jgi:hypothetical protein